jgi:Carboxylesterase family
MVWIHGGGYTLGSKVLYSPSAAGLILESESNGSDGVIWVGLNYRLGAYVRLGLFIPLVSDPFGLIFAVHVLTLTTRVSSLAHRSQGKVAQQMRASLISVLLLSGFSKIFICLEEIRIE